ncbi:DsbA family protein [Tistrella mobilis]|uniref:DsbA family protein n=1 Tax=Tistrella mobilis TaxID=171437 RepID=UPI00355745DD
MAGAVSVTWLFDPLCGWCYGAAPAIHYLAGQAGAVLDPLPVGLFAGSGAFPMNDGFARHAWSADQRIARLSGQPFTEAYRLKVLGAAAGRVDSGPATLALTAVRLAAPADEVVTQELAALEAIQRARYVDGLDNADRGVIAGVLDGLGMAAAAARFQAPDPALLAADRARIAAGREAMRRMGVRGVPALILGKGAGARLLDAGQLFGPTDALVAAIAAA